ncbi:hypothetical protein BH23ACT10_BH23ACT10_36680 [soil metagenome]
MHALILAGGKGTRLRPLTLTCPKPLLPFMAEPYAVGLLRRLRAFDCTDVTFLVGADGTSFDGLRSAGADLGVTVRVTTEERPLDTAGAVRRLLHGRGDTGVLICNGDVLTDVDYGELVRAQPRRQRHRHAGADGGRGHVELRRRRPRR